MKFKSNSWKWYTTKHGRIWYQIKKWLWCSWIHRRHKCHNEVWKENSTQWHCDKCHPCGEELDAMSSKLGPEAYANHVKLNYPEEYVMLYPEKKPYLMAFDMYDEFPKIKKKTDKVTV